MGWLFSSNYANKRDMRYHLTEDNGVKTLKSCWKGNNLWAVQEYTYDQGAKAGQTVRFIALYLCKFYKDEGGYKDMDESSGPYYYNCPVSYIELVEAHEREHGYSPQGYAAEWRAKVREHYARANRTLAIGQQFKLYGKEYVVRGYTRAGGPYIVANLDVGQEFRLRKASIKHVEVLG